MAVTVAEVIVAKLESGSIEQASLSMKTGSCNQYPLMEPWGALVAVCFARLGRAAHPQNTLYSI